MSPAAMPFSSGTGGSAKPGHAVLASLSHRNNSGSAEKCQVTLVILPVARKELPGRTLAYLTTRSAHQKFHGMWRPECMESRGSQRDRKRDRTESREIARDRAGSGTLLWARAAPQLCQGTSDLSRLQTVHRFRAIPLRLRAIPAISAPSLVQ